jgi:hypothetical protein
MKKSNGFLAAIAAVLTTLVAFPASAEQTITCPALINRDIDESVVLVGQGTCTLAARATISGEVTVTDGVSFTVRGKVDGKIDEIGIGQIVINGGTVYNEILETGDGSVRVINLGRVTGQIDESGPGSIEVNKSSVDGDLIESGSGNASAIYGSRVSGNIIESEGGNVAVDATSGVAGNVFEEARGNCVAVVESSVEGVVDCD